MCFFDRTKIIPLNANAWEQERLGDITDRIRRKNENLESDLPLTISAQYGLINQNDFFDKRIASKDLSGYYLLKQGEYAYNKSTSNDAPWGAVKRLEKYDMGVVSTLYIVFSLHQDVNSDYFSTYYSTDLWHKGIREIAAEGARNHGLLNIAPNDFFNMKIIAPKSLDEQRKIGSFFQKLDSSITLHQRVHFGITINHLKNPNAWEQHELWELTIWDKKFNEVDKEKQPETRKYRYALANAINLIIIPGGDIKILSTGSLDAYTTKERAGEYLCNGEIVAIPWGGTPNIKYAKGFFVTGDNRIATSNDLDKLNNRYLYWWFNTPLKHLENIYRGASIKHPSMNDVLNMTIQLPSIPEQKKIIGLLDNIDSLLTFISKCSFTYIIKIFEFTYTIERSLFCFTTFHIIISVSLISKIAMFLFLLIQKQPLGIMFFYI